MQLVVTGVARHGAVLAVLVCGDEDYVEGSSGEAKVNRVKEWIGTGGIRKYLYISRERHRMTGTYERKSRQTLHLGKVGKISWN